MNTICTRYDSPLGKILLAADSEGLCGLWFYGQRHFPAEEMQAGESAVFSDARRWLDMYFSGKEPDFDLPLHLIGTPFQLMVWQQLLQIPYGKTATYGEIAKAVAEKLGKEHMSAQAAGGAVGRNKIGIIVPCHRVIGANGSLTGYAGGIDKKIRLLNLESNAVNFR